MAKKILMIVGILLLLGSLVFGWLKFQDVFSEKPESTTPTVVSPENAEPIPDTETLTPETEPTTPATPQPTTPSSSSFNKSKYSTDQTGSPWIVINKTRPLPNGYVPGDLMVPNVALMTSASQERSKYSKSAVSDLEAMFAAAKAANLTLIFGSGYRSYSTQSQLYNNYVAQDGQAAADRYSARPGHSEHQTGLSFDVAAGDQECYLEICFSNTPEGKWIAANGYKYGFIIRYPNGKESITGFQFEPWHLRWVGTELATEMKRTSTTTMEEFFGLPAAPNYL